MQLDQQLDGTQQATACTAGTSLCHVQMCKGADPTACDSAFHIFAGCPNLIMDLQTDAVLRVLQDGLQGQQSIDVRAFIFLLHKSRCSFDIFVGCAHSFVGFDILSHALRSAPSFIVLIAHVPDA